jgi:hypothetical protein
MNGAHGLPWKSTRWFRSAFLPAAPSCPTWHTWIFLSPRFICLQLARGRKIVSPVRRRIRGDDTGDSCQAPGDHHCPGDALYMAWTKYGAMLLREPGLWAFAACSLLLPLIWYSHAHWISLSYYPHHMFGSGALEPVSLGCYVDIVQQALTSVAIPVASAAMLLRHLPAGASEVRSPIPLVAPGYFAVHDCCGPGTQTPLVSFTGCTCRSRLRWTRLRLCVIQNCETGAVENPRARLDLFLFTVKFLVRLLKTALRTSSCGTVACGKRAHRMTPLDILFAAGDGGDPTCIYYSKRKGWHFLENFGAAPTDSPQAIAELERLRQRGAAYLILTRHQPWWWSERYNNFCSYLDSHYQGARDTENYVSSTWGPPN